MLVLYITYVDFDTAASGSGVRPGKMYRAFLAEGHEIRLLSGAQGNLRTRGTRLQRVKETERWLDSHRPDLCYIESPVYPIMWAADRRLIARVHAMGVPVGYFYRDFYRRFPELYPGPADPVGKLKEKALDVLQDLTETATALFAGVGLAVPEIVRGLLEAGFLYIVQALLQAGHIKLFRHLTCPPGCA